MRDKDPGIGKLLQDIPAVTSVRREADVQPGGYLVDTALGTDLRAELAEFIVKKGWGLLELRPIEMSLEDVFRQLTTEERGVA